MPASVLNETVLDDDSAVDVDKILAETYSLSDQLLSVCAANELSKSKYQVISDVDADMYRWAQQINEYTNKISNLRKLEQGIIHKAIGLKNLALIDDNINIFADRLVSFREIFAKNIIAKNTDFLTTAEIKNIRTNQETYVTIKDTIKGIIDQITSIEEICNSSRVLQQSNQYMSKISSDAEKVVNDLAKNQQSMLATLSNELQDLLQNK